MYCRCTNIMYTHMYVCAIVEILQHARLIWMCYIFGQITMSQCFHQTIIQLQRFAHLGFFRYTQLRNNNTNTHKNVCVYVCTCVCCVCTCLWCVCVVCLCCVCVCIVVYACVCLCMCMFMCVHAYVCVSIYIVRICHTLSKDNETCTYMHVRIY